MYTKCLIQGVSEFCERFRPHIAEFKAQTQQWSEAIKEVDQALRELGDVENLLSVMKEEFDTVKKCAQGM